MHMNLIKGNISTEAQKSSMSESNTFWPTYAARLHYVAPMLHSLLLMGDAKGHVKTTYHPKPLFNLPGSTFSFVF